MSENYVFGYEQLPVRGDILFFIGGEKDVISLAAHGFKAICMNSETAIIPKSCFAASLTGLSTSYCSTIWTKPAPRPWNGCARSTLTSASKV